MVSSPETQYLPETVSAPGEILEELLEERGMSQADLARRTGRPTKTINEIVTGKSAITTETALQFERVFGVPARFWNNLEKSYREHLTRREERKRLVNQISWLQLFPLKAMVDCGWIEKKTDAAEQVASLLGFFGVSSTAAWQDTRKRYQAAFRLSGAFEVDPGAVAAWLRRGELEAQNIDCRAFDAEVFKSTLRAIRALTRERPEVFQDRLQQLCSEAGVAVTFVPQMPKSRVSGATRWLTPQKALIQLSLRYKTDDHLWFTFFHECGHILKHGKKLVFLESSALESSDTEGRMEEEANRFAASFLIPDEAYRHLVRQGDFACDRLRQFAVKIGVSPGIVVGRLQHDGRIPFDRCNSLKKRVSLGA